MQMPWPHPWTCSRRATGHPPRSWQTPASRAISPPCTRTTRASRAARWTSTSSLNEKPKAVFSHTLKKAEWGPAEIFGGDLGAEIAELKARDHEGTVLVHGGPDFAKSLTRLGSSFEYQLTTVPIAIGAGHSPFAELAEHLKLDVVEEERFQSGALAQILVPTR